MKKTGCGVSELQSRQFRERETETGMCAENRRENQSTLCVIYWGGKRQPL